MDTTIATIAPPTHLLLATDLSARCDRALDRAAQLANEWRAELIALNVLDVASPPDAALAWAIGDNEEQALQLARQQLARDLAGLDVSATMHIARSADTAASIREAAAQAACWIVVTGVARNELLGRFLLGSIAARLARSLPQPLLVVRARVHGSYRRIVVATDFSEASRRALSTAAHFFPGRELILYHACEYRTGRISGHLPDAGADFTAEYRQCAEFLAATALPAGATVRPAVTAGPLETTLTDYVRRHDIELVAMGAYGRGHIMGTVLGSSAVKLLDWLPCDALLVRESLTDGR